MHVQDLGALERSTLRERCLLALRSALTAGRFPPGGHLNEVELATLFGVSRATVREALRHLQQEGLIVVGSRGMLHVRQLNSDEIREIYSVRAALEALAAETLSALDDRRRVGAELQAAVALLDASEGNLPAQIEADLAFHLKLCELSGNRTLVASWRSIAGPIRVTIMHAGLERALHNMAAARHRPIVQAIEVGKPDIARSVVFGHMMQAAERLVQATDAGQQDLIPAARPI
jgi:DNA-binding GntR family transcriptional regulator